MIAMYAGYKFFGLSGLIIGPVIYVVVKSVLSNYMRGRNFKQMIFGDDS